MGKLERSLMIESCVRVSSVECHLDIMVFDNDSVVKSSIEKLIAAMSTRFSERKSTK